jgi:predicted Rossmann-fold nucleotide-binding protein
LNETTLQKMSSELKKEIAAPNWYIVTTGGRKDGMRKTSTALASSSDVSTHLFPSPIISQTLARQSLRRGAAALLQDAKTEGNWRIGVTRRPVDVQVAGLQWLT